MEAIMEIYRVKNIKKEERIRIERFVRDIKGGYHNWKEEDIQLYQNNSEVIEKLLKGEKIDWCDNEKKEEDSSYMTLKELKRILGII